MPTPYFNRPLLDFLETPAGPAYSRPCESARLTQNSSDFWTPSGSDKSVRTSNQRSPVPFSLVLFLSHPPHDVESDQEPERIHKAKNSHEHS